MRMCLADLQLQGSNWLRAPTAALWAPFLCWCWTPPTGNWVWQESWDGPIPGCPKTLLMASFGSKTPLTVLLTLPQLSWQSRTLPLNRPSMHSRMCFIVLWLSQPSLSSQSLSLKGLSPKILACLILSWCLGGRVLTHWIWFKNLVGNSIKRKAKFPLPTLC